MRIPSLRLTNQTADMLVKGFVVETIGQNYCSGECRALEGTVLVRLPFTFNTWCYRTQTLWRLKF
jgi:hypothetical protein